MKRAFPHCRKARSGRSETPFRNALTANILQRPDRTTTQYRIRRDKDKHSHKKQSNAGKMPEKHGKFGKKP